MQQVESPTQLAEEFDEGLQAGLDPLQTPSSSAGPTLTTLRSPWLQRRCERCGHTFRRDDRVRRRDDGSVVHAEGTTFCDPSSACETTTSALVTEFYVGLHEAWPPPGGVRVVRLEPGHPLLVPPRGGFERRRCALCGHTLRPQEQVVICPCRP